MQAEVPEQPPPAEGESQIPYLVPIRVPHTWCRSEYPIAGADQSTPYLVPIREYPIPGADQRVPLFIEYHLGSLLVGAFAAATGTRAVLAGQPV